MKRLGLQTMGPPPGRSSRSPRCLRLTWPTGAVLAMLCLAPAPVLAVEEGGAQATMPLAHYVELQDTVERLRRNLDQAQSERGLRGAGLHVSRFEIRGRLTDGNLVGTAYVDIDIAGHGAQESPGIASPEARASTVAATGDTNSAAQQVAAATGATLVAEPSTGHALLLPKQPGLHITTIPRLAPASGLSLFSDAAGLHVFGGAPGRHSLEIGLIIAGEALGTSQWRVKLRFGEATVRRLLVRYDDHLFRLQSRRISRDGESSVLVPSGDSVVLAWQQVGERRSERNQKRAPIEPSVVSGTGSLVATLDGQVIGRYLFDLHLQGRETITLSVPDGGKPTKVFVNGASVTFTAQEENGITRLAIGVAPPRPGDTSARLEVVVREERPPMSLGGALRFGLPTVSWGVSRLTAVLHLPEVFTYRWTGGSLSRTRATTAKENAVDFSLAMPTPGRPIALAQELVRGTADVEIAYTVDLEGHYFK